MTTRDGFPELWGVQEIADYGERIAEEHDDPVGRDRRRVSRQRAQDWTERKGFPEPVAKLAMGPVWLAEEAAPKIEAIMEAARTGPSSTELSPQTRAAILALKDGPRGVGDVADEFGVNRSTVYRIWHGRR